MAIIHNAARCLKCETTIRSTHRHDFQTCKCGGCSVDGGDAYLRRVGDPALMDDRSLVIDDDRLPRVLREVWDALNDRRSDAAARSRALKIIQDAGRRPEPCPTS